MLPEKTGGKILNATVLSVGSGIRNKDGQNVPLSVKAGDKVLLPDYGGTRVEIENKEYFIFRESDIIGKWSE
jgi:chaperonin GroES